MINTILYMYSLIYWHIAHIQQFLLLKFPFNRLFYDTQELRWIYSSPGLFIIIIIIIIILPYYCYI